MRRAGPSGAAEHELVRATLEETSELYVRRFAERDRACSERRAVARRHRRDSVIPGQRDGLVLLRRKERHALRILGRELRHRERTFGERADRWLVGLVS